MITQFTASGNPEEDPANRFPRGGAFFVPESSLFWEQKGDNGTTAGSYVVAG